MIMNKKLIALAVSSAMLLTACDSDDDDDPMLTRLATTPVKAELTGMFKTENGDFFFNIQHPDSSLLNGEGLAAVGAWSGVNLNQLDKNLSELAAPELDSADSKTTKVAVGEYQVLGREGYTFAGDLPFGLGNIVTADGTTSIKQSNDPDFNAFVSANADGSEGFLFTAWEDRPGAVSRMKLTKTEEGTWSVGQVMNVDFSSVNGTMINCFGSLSPWGTPLTSEENYMAEATSVWNNENLEGGYPSYYDVKNIQSYLGGTFPNPYDYGYIVEITKPQLANPVPVKHFTMGRMAHENAVIMPDNKTVYLTDDGGYKGFYKFVADEAGDLSSGTLYVAKVTQDDTADSASTGFDINWMAMGYSNNSNIETFIRSFDGIDESDYVADQTNYVTDQQIADHVSGDSLIEALPFVETHRVATAMGATMEFNKMEGININYGSAKDGSVPYMYVAMSDVAKGMTDDSGDIQISENRCGIVYRFELLADFNIDRMEPAVVGGSYDGELSVNQCDVDGIANPDNLEVLDDGRVLIGEDTGRHNNNMLWVYNPAGK